MAYAGIAAAVLLALVLVSIVAMQTWRLADNRAIETAWAWLQSHAPATIEVCGPAMAESRHCQQ